jgi:lathosterol oxidase
MFLGIMGLLAVAAFHYPEYLTTPALREVYREYQVRTLLYTGLVLTSIIAPVALLFSQRKTQAILGLTCVLLAWLAGGADVTYGDKVRDSRFYISLDWVLLDLIIIATLFVSLERFSRLRIEQKVLRCGWRVDLAHYVANHIFNGGIVFILFLPAHWVSSYLSLDETRAFLSGLPLMVQVLLIMLVTDLVQYWVHRAFHQIPFLWRFHRVHHSVEVMDWLAGSRLHIVDVLVTRSLSLVPMIVLGFSSEAINIYLPILALQSVFIHSNFRPGLGSISKVVTTPRFHHWHHTSDPQHLDRNFAISLPLLDLLFGTYYCPRDEWPRRYGLVGEHLDGGYWAHLLSPLRAQPVVDIRAGHRARATENH